MALYIWLNAVPALLAVLAIVGIPLWMTLRYPERAPDFSEARAYLRAKAEAAESADVAGARRPVDLTSHQHAAAA